jgi:hypothetical protein
MKKLLFLFTFYRLAVQTQNFPYLNASTGNTGHFIDKDTNIYFVHGNRLCKTDKNFVFQWGKTYSNID